MSELPTSVELLNDEGVPYFVWWLPCTVGALERWLGDPDPELRAYWLGVLLREANTRDVWLFTTPDEVRAMWPRLLPHLGRASAMWAWLLELPQPVWPPEQAQRA